MEEATSSKASQLESLSKHSTTIFVGAAGIVRKKSVSNLDTIARFASNVGLNELSHNVDKVSENKLFIQEVTKVLKELIGKLNFDKSNA